MNPRKRLASPGRPVVVGHRGAMGYDPENTMRSFRHAIELGADWIEFDVHLAADGTPVVIHDETLDRTTNGKGWVGKHTLEQLRGLDAGSHRGAQFAGERIPTLDEVLTWAHDAPTFVDIEIKSGPVRYSGIERAVVEALDRAAMIDRAIVISFDHHAVRRVRELSEKLATGVLYAGRPIDGIGMAQAAGADALLPHWAYVLAEDVQVAHASGIAVAPWVTSDPAIARQLFEMGVDALGTNHPDVIRTVADGFGLHARSGP